MSAECSLMCILTHIHHPFSSPSGLKLASQLSWKQSWPSDRWKVDSSNLIFIVCWNIVSLRQRKAITHVLTYEHASCISLYIMQDASQAHDKKVHMLVLECSFGNAHPMDQVISFVSWAQLNSSIEKLCSSGKQTSESVVCVDTHQLALMLSARPSLCLDKKHPDCTCVLSVK